MSNEQEVNDLVYALKKFTKELEMVNSILLAVNASQTVEQLCQLAGEEIHNLVPFDRASIALYDEEKKRLRVFGLYGRDTGSLGIGAEGKFEGSVTQLALKERKIILLSDINEETRKSFINYEDLINEGFQSSVCVPLYSANKSLGSLNLTSRKENAFTEDHVFHLNRLLLPLSLAVEKAELLDKTARLVEELKQVNKIKDDFLTTVSHELRTPLMAIKGWTVLLKSNPIIQRDPEVLEGFNVIQNTTHSLSLLISDLLDMSRLERQALKLNLQPLDVNASLAEAIQAVRHLAKDKGLRLSMELEQSLPEIKADKQRVQQVLWNLLTNAIKFTPEGGRVIARTRLAAASDKQMIALEVEDTGVGIPEDFLPEVWERFKQAETSEKKSGLGIGLSLVKELTEAHGGHATVDSDSGGTMFTIYLPVNQ